MRPLHGCCIALVIQGWILVAAAFVCAASPGEKSVVLQDVPSRLAWQIALEREGFSPGLLDGKIGTKTQLATAQFQLSCGLKGDGRLDQTTYDALKIDPATAIGEHLIEPADLKGITPFTEDWLIRASQDEMGYYTVLDGLAERFHTTKGLLKGLNPGVDFETVQVGTPLKVPALCEPLAVKASSLEVDLNRKLIFAQDASGKIIAMFHCSIAAKAEKRPAGETTVVTVAVRPDYTFDPAMWPEVTNVTKKLRIAPGPRNPVGLAWVGLGLPGYGMHGTPHPEMIGKTGSHGCFRMTNWDAVRLAKMVRIGAKVVFIGGQR